MHTALHLRDGIDRLYVPSKEGEKNSVALDTSTQGLEEFIIKSKERLTTATRNSSGNIKKENTITRKQKLKEKQLYVYFKWQIDKISNKNGSLQRKGNSKWEIVSLLIATQNYTIRTNYIKENIYNTQHRSTCRLCGDRNEAIYLMISKCNKLVQMVYKTRHILGEEGDPLGIVQEIKIWPWYQMVHAQSIIRHG